MLQQQFPPQRLQTPQWRSILFAIVAFLGVLLALPGFLFGMLLQKRAARSWDQTDSWSGMWVGAILCTIGYIALATIWHIYGFFTPIFHGPFAAAFLKLLELWGYHVFLAPVFALILEGIQPKRQRARRQQPLLQSAPVHSGANQSENFIDAEPADPTATAAPSISIVQTVAGIENEMIVGKAIDGDLWQLVRSGWLTYPQRLLTHHALLLGKPGSGKTETSLRLAYGARRCYGMKVFYIDGKGDWKTAAQFKLAMEAAGAKRVGCFPVDRHNGWYGTRQDIINRLMNCQRFSDSYYEGHTLNLLKYAFYQPGREAPKDSLELIERLYPPALKAAYKSSPEYEYLQSLRPDVFWGPHGRYSALFNAIGNGLDGEHGFGHWDCCYYLLDEKRLQRQNAIFAKLLLDDFEMYLAHRELQPGPHPAIMLIIDDYSAFSDLVSIRNLLERLRSANVSVIASAQGIHSLGSSLQEQQRLLGSAATHILHNCIFPQELIKAAGTRRIPEVTQYMSPGKEQDASASDGEQDNFSIHMREEPNIDPNDIQQLETGEIYFVKAPYYERARVEPIPLDQELVKAVQIDLQRKVVQEQSAYEAAQAARMARRSSSRKATGGRKSRPAANTTGNTGSQRNTGPQSQGQQGKETKKPGSLDDLL